jgi:hypothetical protein
MNRGSLYASRLDDHVIPDDCIHHYRVRPNDASTTNHRAAVQHGPSEKLCIGVKVHASINRGSFRILHRDTSCEPRRHNSATHHALRESKLRAVIDACNFVFLGDERIGLVAGIEEDTNDVSEVQLTLGVASRYPPQRRTKERSPEAVNRRINLADILLFSAGIGLLHNASDSAIARP